MKSPIPDRIGLQLLLTVALSGIGCRALYDSTVYLHPEPRTRGLSADSLQDVLTLPEEEIDIGRAVLLAAREHRPELDIDTYLARLDDLAAKLKRRLPEGIGAQDAVTQLVRVVQPESLQPPLPDLLSNPSQFPARIDISRILDGDSGNCLGISLLYLAVAERVGLPVYGVSAPEHVFVRFDDSVTRINIEPTLGGQRLSDKEYQSRRLVAPETVERGIYLRSESKRQVLASLLANRAGYRALSGNAPRALEDARRALAIKPYWPQAHVNKGLALELLQRDADAEACYHRALQLDPHNGGALNNLAALYVRHATSGTPVSGELESAERMIRRALEVYPTRAEFHETAAAVAAARGDLRQALRRLRRASHFASDKTRYMSEMLRIREALEGVRREQ